MVRMGVNSDLPQKRRFPASSFEFRLFLYGRDFRILHPPLAYMFARARRRVSGGRPVRVAHKRAYWRGWARARIMLGPVCPWT